MLRYLAFGSIDQARAYAETFACYDRELAHQIETQKLEELFRGIDPLVVHDDWSRTGDTREGRPLRPCGRRTA